MSYLSPTEVRETRKESERQFHNRRFGDEEDVRAPLNRWYGAVDACALEQNRLVREYGKGGKVLEYGCADGRISLARDNFVDEMKLFHGIDISEQAIDSARRSAALQKRKNCRFSAMDAEHMTFPNDEFDVVFGSGILHHLDLDNGFAEIHRVLKPGGKAIFSEPLGHNPALNLFRKFTPGVRTPDEHPLLMEDLKLAREYSRKVECRYFGLTTLLAVPFEEPFAHSAPMRLCERLDTLLFHLPFIRRNAWFVLLVMTK
jgi:SAM-dependent methyltransferase